MLKCAERTELLRLPVKRESWLGGGGDGSGGSWWWWGWELYSRNKEFRSRNNGLKQTLRGHGLFDGMSLVWCLPAFICCLRCLGELETVRTCGCYVKPELHLLLFFFFLFKTGNPNYDPRRIKRDALEGEAGIDSAFYFFYFFPSLIKWSVGISSGVKRWLINFLQSLWCNSPGHGKASHFTRA